jgi:hypothetical protein
VSAFGKARGPRFRGKSEASKRSGEAKREKTGAEGEAFQEQECIYARFLGIRSAKVRFFGSPTRLFMGFVAAEAGEKRRNTQR